MAKEVGQPVKTFFVGQDRGLPSTPRGRKFHRSRRVTPGDDLYCNEGLVPLEKILTPKKTTGKLSIILKIEKKRKILCEMELTINHQILFSIKLKRAQNSRDF